MTSPEWEFDYAPLHTYSPPGTAGSDFVVATSDDVDSAKVAEPLRDLMARVVVTPILSVHPLYWFRLELSAPLTVRELEDLLRALPVRYVVSATSGDQRIGPLPDFTTARPRRARDWRVRAARPVPSQTPEQHWFLGHFGASVLRGVCGTGAGTRLAVIDNDGMRVDRLELDAEILVGLEQAPRSSNHGALMVGWAVGCAPDAGGQRFLGVAPDASPRLYYIPKGGERVFDLPHAIVRAVDDGADVVLCATYVDGQTSALLDDALEFAWRLGRGGRGTPVVFPSSREMSSPPGSVHSSLSLGLGEPASDPRVFCIGPSSRDGRWFCWRDRAGRQRPFANRGPALRWLAPGDDLPYPLGDSPKVVHAESSGAAAVAAGVMLLVLCQNPELSPGELDCLLTTTAHEVVSYEPGELHQPADAHDWLPTGVDRDGHNAKHGYGRINCAGACAAARDPAACALALIGEVGAAVALELAVHEGRVNRPYSSVLGRWLVGGVLRDASLQHAASALARSLRLLSARPHRAEQQPPGALLRQVLVMLRSPVVASSAGHDIRAELDVLASTLRSLADSDARAVERIVVECAQYVRALDQGRSGPGARGEVGRAGSSRDVASPSTG